MELELTECSLAEILSEIESIAILEADRKERSFHIPFDNEDLSEFND